MSKLKTHLCAAIDIDMWEYFGHEMDEMEMAYRVDGLTKILANAETLPLALGIDGDRHLYLVFRRTVDLVDIRSALEGALAASSGSLKKYNAWRKEKGLEPALSFSPLHADPPDQSDLEWLLGKD